MSVGKSVVILGSQWGDEGKGKVVDWLASHVAAAVRFQGGNNAGHTLVINGRRIVLTLLPSGILQAGVYNVIGNGVVVALDALFAEIDRLQIECKQPIVDWLRISPACSMVLPTHIALDKAREARKGRTPIGTTLRGIGPTYSDKISRLGLRLGDLLYPEKFRERAEELLDFHNFLLTNYYQAEPCDKLAIIEACLAYADRLAPMLADVPLLLQQLRKQGQNILFEGAQGTFLDVDHGTYPFVTSSNTTAGAVSTGCGFGPRYIDEVLGITKAYTTRVGGGPFPSQFDEKLGQYIATRGREVGSVTGRPRRCGWFDAPLLRRSNMINSLSQLCITKLDVLDELAEIKIVVGYRWQDQEFSVSPINTLQFTECQPIYETHVGWQQSTAGVTELAKLPKLARAYLDRIAELVEVPIAMISTGAERSEIILLKNPF
jgi:adenylosuccinate synthase